MGEAHTNDFPSPHRHYRHTHSQTPLRFRKHKSPVILGTGLQWRNRLLTESGGELFSLDYRATPHISTISYLRNKGRAPETSAFLAGRQTGFGTGWLRAKWVSHSPAGSDWGSDWSWNIAEGPRVPNSRLQNKSSPVVNLRKQFPRLHPVYYGFAFRLYL